MWNRLRMQGQMLEAIDVLIISADVTSVMHQQSDNAVKLYRMALFGLRTPALSLILKGFEKLRRIAHAMS